MDRHAVFLAPAQPAGCSARGHESTCERAGFWHLTGPVIMASEIDQMRTYRGFEAGVALAWKRALLTRG